MPLVSLETTPSIPVYKILDTLAGINGVDVNTSYVAGSPAVLQIEAVPAATSVAIQVRVEASAAWSTIQTVAASTAVPTIITMPVRYNFVRAVRTGAGDITVFSQE